MPALREATSTIPVAMGRMDDVLEHGSVTSLARPGGNITGLSFQTGELSGKRLDLVREVLRKLLRAAVLWDTSGTSGQLRTAEQAARSMGLQLQVSKVLGSNELDHALEGTESSTRKLWSFGIAHLHSATGAIGGSNC